MAYFSNREFNLSANLHKHQTAIEEIINAIKVYKRNGKKWDCVEEIEEILKEYKLKWTKNKRKKTSDANVENFGESICFKRKQFVRDVEQL